MLFVFTKCRFPSALVLASVGQAAAEAKAARTGPGRKSYGYLTLLGQQMRGAAWCGDGAAAPSYRWARRGGIGASRSAVSR